LAEETFEDRARVLVDVQQAAASAAEGLQTSADVWMLRPAAEFRTAVEHLLTSTDGNVRLSLAFLVLIIRDIMQNLSGDVPYNVLGEALDAARANVQRALRATLRTLADDLSSKGKDLTDTLENCSGLAAEYFSTIERLNRKEGS
jgi:hypothetical protein